MNIQAGINSYVVLHVEPNIILTKVSSRRITLVEIAETAKHEISETVARKLPVERKHPVHIDRSNRIQLVVDPIRPERNVVTALNPVHVIGNLPRVVVPEGRNCAANIEVISY